MPRGVHNNHASGAKQGRWNDGRMLSSQGYVKLRVVKTHPWADRNGYCYEHKLVWLSAFRTLLAGCVIHHINGDKTDNRLENLQMMPRCVHNALHNKAKGRKADGTFGKKAAGHLLDGREWHDFPEVQHASL